VAKTWSFAHVHIDNEDERCQLEGIPVIFDVEKDFFFEADDDTGIVKK